MTENAKLTPCYVPFDTFEAFVGRLKQTTVPDTVHKSLMPNLAGAIQSHLIASLRFLDLIDVNGKVLPDLHPLVDAYGTPTWKPALQQLIEKAYKPVIGDLNIEKAIGKTLQDRFKDATSYDGTTLDKAIRFYIKALKTAGVNVSPFIKVRKSGAGRRPASGNGRANNTAGANPPPAEPARQGANPPPVEKPPVVPAGMISIPIYSPGKPAGSITVHEDFDEADCTMIHAILLAYAKRRSEAN